jgi:hypothetical protein
MTMPASALQQIGDGVPVAAYRDDVIAEGAAGDAVQVAAFIVIGEGQVDHPDRFPLPHLLAIRPRRRRHHGLRIASQALDFVRREG